MTAPTEPMSYSPVRSVTPRTVFRGLRSRFCGGVFFLIPKRIDAVGFYFLWQHSPGT